MAIAYNSAYVQTEPLNFTFTRQPLLCILMPTLSINVGHNNGVISSTPFADVRTWMH